MVVKSRFSFTNFLFGAILGLFLLILAFLAIFELSFKEKVYPGVKVAGILVGGKTINEIEDYFEVQNAAFANLAFTFTFEKKIATISGEKLKVGYDSKLLGDQAFLIGRSGNAASALYQKFGKTNLASSYRFDSEALDDFLENFAQQIDIPAQEALFQFSGGRVTAFRPSAPGQALDRGRGKNDFAKLLSPPTSGTIVLEVVSVEARVKTEDVNNLGIKELLGEGKSFFRGSIPTRVHNISLASSRLNGILITPGEVFSFNQALGEVSANTGYKQAYIIKEKKTILDDGGGVCQVSTTFFRAALAAGLPIEERQAHAYRVSYYEEGGFGPGLDATVYAPRVDLKIKNDTPAHILIQARVDTKNAVLIFELYGTSDKRKATIGKPRVWDQVPPPPDLYQDDPNLPKGQNRQIDFAAWGAKTAFD
ncbi:VanW family protein [Candidatus Gottesmanbacteria bacterium]|nr:VanW family protein [Candidatus Gottesmanbacteria bacterium]